MLRFGLLFILVVAAALTREGLFVALVFGTLVVPGYVLVERFFPDFEGRVPLSVLLSVLVSTQLVYFLSLGLGYSLDTLRIASVLLLLPLAAAPRPRYGRWDHLQFGLYAALFLFCLGVLWDQVWFHGDTGYVLSGSNWQDTPFHYEIIHTLNAGNFPPQDPSFAGEPLHYHYFVDLHTAILEMPLGFEPRILLYVNAALFPLFFLGVMALGRRVTGSHWASFYGAVLAVFGWGFIYLWLFDAAMKGEFHPSLGYVMDYEGLLNLPPPLDNLLQQRPLLVGLPGLVLSVAAFVRGYGEREWRYVLLSGAAAGLLFPFHVLATAATFGFAGVYVAVEAVQSRPGLDGVRERAAMLVPLGVALLFVAPHLGLLAPGGDPKPSWVSEFVDVAFPLHYLANLGLPLLLATIAFLAGVKNRLLTGTWIASLLAIPLLPSLTPNPWDMYKFFHLAWIPISILAGQLLARLQERDVRLTGVVALLLVLSTLSTVPVILWNSTEYTAAGEDEYHAGTWVRVATPEDAVFLTWPSLHSPPTMIGGRTRVLGYTNWAYGHGVELDRVTGRLNEVTEAYQDPGSLEQVVERYGVDYVYVGPAERDQFDNPEEVLERSPVLEPVIEGDTVTIYRVTDPP